jgi:Tfp pilus assembly protein PilF
LETLSLRRFEDGLPENFHFVPSQRREYGIDGAVEVFSESTDDATGIRFDVQVKSTDEQNIDAALRIDDLKVSTVNYYQLLERPILISLYHAPTDTVYVKWFHTHRPFETTPNQRTVTFNMAPRRVLTPQIGTDLVAEAQAFYAYTPRQMDFPLSFSVVGELSAVDITAYDVLLSLRDLRPGLEDLVDFDDQARAGKPALAFSSTGITADLGGVRRVQLITPSDYSPSDSNDVAADALVTVAATFTAIQMFNQAARIAEIALPHSAWALHEDIPSIILDAFVRSRRIVEALNLSRDLISQDYGRFKELVTTLMLTAFEIEELTDNEHHALIAALTALRDAASSADDTRQVAAAIYSMGNAYRSRKDLESARASYEQAARVDQSYESRSYYWKELAGVYFLSGAFSEANNAYTRATELGDDSDLVRGLRADSLLWMGRYSDAHQEYLEVGRSDPLWRLRQHATNAIIDMLGQGDQDRNAAAAEQMIDDAYFANLEVDEMASVCMNAIQLDALCSSAWFNLGVAVQEPGTAADGWIFFLVAAVTREDDVEAWWNAFLCGMDAGREESYIEDLVEAAYRLNGNRFTQGVNQWAREAGLGPQRAELMRIIDSGLREIPMQPTERTIRANLPDAD